MDSSPSLQMNLRTAIEFTWHPKIRNLVRATIHKSMSIRNFLGISNPNFQTTEYWSSPRYLTLALTLQEIDLNPNCIVFEIPIARFQRANIGIDVSQPWNQLRAINGLCVQVVSHHRKRHQNPSRNNQQRGGLSLQLWMERKNCIYQRSLFIDWLNVWKNSSRSKQDFKLCRQSKIQKRNQFHHFIWSVVHPIRFLSKPILIDRLSF